MKKDGLLVPEILRHKRDGEELNEPEILHLVRGAADGSIPDYQISAWLMASYLKGCTRRETLSLTRGIKESGESFDWKQLSSAFKDARFADKHSSGGVGDKVSLLLAPIAACLGLKVPMMSGRSLGHTGGTVDKLESIPGFRMNPTRREMIEWLERSGLFMSAQTRDLCPADRKLYHLRDVTATIESIPLIRSDSATASRTSLGAGLWPTSRRENSLTRCWPAPMATSRSSKPLRRIYRRRGGSAA